MKKLLVLMFVAVFAVGCGSKGGSTLAETPDVLLPEERLTDNMGISWTSWNNTWCIATDSAGNVHMVWMDDQHDDNPGKSPFIGEIYYKRWSNGSWGNDERLTNDMANSENPSIATDINGNVHVVWMDDREGHSEIYYKKWDGNQWGDEIKIANDDKISEFPIVATDPMGDVYIVWQDQRDGNYEIYYTHWNGISWEEEKLTNDGADSIYPSVAVDSDGNVHVVFEDNRDGSNGIYYTHWNGISWEADLRLTNDGVDSRYPSVAVDSDGNVHVVFDDLRDGNLDGNLEIYYKRKQGQSWSEDIRLTDKSGRSQIPSIATDSMNNVHVVWFDRRFSRNGEDLHNEVIYKKWSSSEGKWGTEIYKNDGIYSGFPSVATDLDGNVHTVFEDGRNLEAEANNMEIYYQKYLAR